MDRLLHQEVSSAIIGAFYHLYNDLGPGLPELVYQRALCVALRELGIAHVVEARFVVRYKGVDVGTFRADLVVADRVVVELKCAERIVKEHIRQTLYYLKAANLSLGLILNAGPTASFKRVIR